MKDVTFGQYYPVNSIVHRMDPRVKILLLIAYITMIFCVKTFYGMATVGLFLVAVITISHLPIMRVLKSMRGILFIIIFTSIINVFFHVSENEQVIWEWWKLRVTDQSIIFALFMVTRLSLLILGSCILTLTSTPVELTDGIESLLKPLKIIRFPVHELALIMNIALRSIPSIMEEADRIISAQKARGAEFESGNIIKRAKALLPVLIPLLISAFRRAEELGDAMDARCYSESKVRTKFKKLKMGVRDLVAALVVAAFFAAVIYLNIRMVAII